MIGRLNAGHSSWQARIPAIWPHVGFRELASVPENDLDALLGFIHSLKSGDAEDAAPTLLAESSLRKDWLSPEEEAAWADL
jgi:hypothetical protein